MKRHEGSRPGLIRCRTASKTTNAAAPAKDIRAAVREIAVAGLAAVAVASVIRISLLDPGRCRFVAAAPGIVPGASEGCAVFAEDTSVVRRGPPLSAPDRECVPLHHVVVEAGLYLLGRLNPEWPLVPDDLDAPDPLPVLLEVDALEEEEAILHPLVGDLSLRASRGLPRADQPVPEAPQVGARLGLLVGLSVVGVLFHQNCSSFPSGCASWSLHRRPPSVTRA